MSQSSMTCADERQLGSELAQSLGYATTRSSFQDSGYNPQKILKTALEESTEKGGLDELLTNALQGPAWWSYVVLRYAPDLGDRRDEFLNKAAQDPKSALYTLKFIPDLGSYRDALIARTMEDSGWAASALRHIPDLSQHTAASRSAATTPPVEIGWGYNTYFVNQSGMELWVSYNTGEMGSDGSITGPHQLNIGQNVGWGRGGGVITEARVWTSNPDPNNDQSAEGWHTQTGFLGSWQLPMGANGAKSWGFRIDKTGFVEEDQWFSGGMPDNYPPSNGN
ncbi:MAG: hypothetical protein LH618_02745 [Saprospiraceae bacterium]|nr:hypothetical protein [Saprospiraceae bacterium]